MEDGVEKSQRTQGATEESSRQDRDLGRKILFKCSKGRLVIGRRLCPRLLQSDLAGLDLGIGLSETSTFSLVVLGLFSTISQMTLACIDCAVDTKRWVRKHVRVLEVHCE